MTGGEKGEVLFMKTVPRLEGFWGAGDYDAVAEDEFVVC
jgi:hypothetical protein